MPTRKQAPTIREVARACGVSPSAVSFVLNNRPGEVGPETRERVLRAVRELGYRPRPAPPQTERRGAVTLGVASGASGESLVAPGYYQFVLGSVLIAADHRHLNLTLFAHSLLHDDPHGGIRHYCEGRCDGVLVIAPGIGSPLLAALQERGFPFVAIGDNPGDDLTPCVDLDNEAAAQEATEFLIGQGHRRIGFMGGPDFVRSSTQRWEGYRNTLLRHGISPVTAWEIGGVTWPLMLRRFQEMFGLPARQRPTALVCWNDGTARDCLAALCELGLRVPEDISLIGCDDDVFATTLTPPLATMRQPYREIGRNAVELLLALIHDPARPTRRVLLPAELVVRESAGPPSVE